MSYNVGRNNLCVNLYIVFLSLIVAQSCLSEITLWCKQQGLNETVDFLGCWQESNKIVVAVTSISIVTSFEL